MTTDVEAARKDIVEGVPEMWRIYLRQIEFTAYLGGNLELKLTVGLMNPTGPFPWASRASFTSVIIEPTTGVEAEVPNCEILSTWPVKG